eukprot:COSAG01_NODE_6329_length_3732_cov_72.932838_3_plen_206_part_00
MQPLTDWLSPEPLRNRACHAGPPRPVSRSGQLGPYGEPSRVGPARATAQLTNAPRHHQAARTGRGSSWRTTLRPQNACVRTSSRSSAAVQLSRPPLRRAAPIAARTYQQRQAPPPSPLSVWRHKHKYSERYKCSHDQPPELSARLKKKHGCAHRHVLRVARNTQIGEVRGSLQGHRADGVLGRDAESPVIGVKGALPSAGNQHGG